MNRYKYVIEYLGFSFYGNVAQGKEMLKKKNAKTKLNLLVDTINDGKDE